MSLRRVIEHSVAATLSEGTMEMRRSQVKEIHPAHIRLAVQSIDTVVFVVPTIKLAFERMGMERNGLHFIGSGAESRVYSDGERVLKYVKGSELLSSTARKELSDKKKAEFGQLQAHLAPFVLDQMIDVAPHAVKKKKEVVQTTQVHTVFDSLLEVTQSTGEVRLHDTTTDMLDKLSDFVDASWRLYGSTSLLPDTNGMDNVVQSENGLLLIDTQPITTEQAPIQEIVLRQLGSIASLLDGIS